MRLSGEFERSFMPNFGVFLAPLVLLLPLPAANDAVVPDSSRGQVLLTAEPQPVAAKPKHIPMAAESAHDIPVQYQVRIERRLTIRVAPRRPVVRRSLTADLPNQPQPKRLVERKFGKCLKMNGIVGVTATRDNRLMLYMRDQKLIAANLEKACTARDFYSGFYVEPSKDGNLCIERDRVQSRTGVKCKLSRLRQMVRE